MNGTESYPTPWRLIAQGVLRRDTCDECTRATADRVRRELSADSWQFAYRCPRGHVTRLSEVQRPRRTGEPSMPFFDPTDPEAPTVADFMATFRSEGDPTS